MQNKAVPTGADPALLPSVDEMLNREGTREILREFGRERVVEMVRTVIAEARARLLSGSGPFADRTALATELAGHLERRAAAERMGGVRRVINATGVVVHTNLGRAPLSPSAVDAMVAAAGYSTIEYDLAAGSRGARGGRAVELLTRLTGAEDALAVNNCAAAALLVLSVFAAGREVIVSRGELVEIGGDFRIPDILARSGAVLREVGTTNRTHLRDYQNAICDRTAMILKVHPSNFRITGFTKAPDTAELAALARDRSLIFYEDAGSGAMSDLQTVGITGEPVISNVVASGAGLVSFSGDKLLGGPQAGLIAGRHDLVQRLRRDPFYRALRLDKVITAALEATLDAYARGTAERAVPTLQMLSAGAGEIEDRSRMFVDQFDDAGKRKGRLRVELIAGTSAVGGGAGPGVGLPTTLIALAHPEFSDAELAQILRTAAVPVITRIENGRVLIDLRTVQPTEEPDLLRALVQLG